MFDSGFVAVLHRGLAAEFHASLVIDSDAFDPNRVAHFHNVFDFIDAEIGYRLDAKGNPTFLNEQGGVKVEETYEGIENGLRRTVIWAPTPDFTPTITHPSGMIVDVKESSAQGRRVFTYLWK